jgi:very-short-patch-repair endonuclease
MLEFRTWSSSLIEQVRQHLVRNQDDWTAEEFLETVGAFQASDIRFTRFLESLTSADVRPDEQSQREFAALVNSAIVRTGVELREIGEEEVWLHWDPKTVHERGPKALTRFRMDFLMLLPGETRIVIEVDGLRHYTNEQGAGDAERYAAMVRGDRDLQLAGYQVYRFGAVELNHRDVLARMADFFERMLRRHGVTD